MDSTTRRKRRTDRRCHAEVAQDWETGRTIHAKVGQDFGNDNKD